MNKKLFALLAISTCALLTTAAAKGKQSDSIKGLLDMQAAAWNEGDLKTFMTGYKHSKEVSYTSSGKIIDGYDALEAHYEKRYGKNSDTMGKLDFTILKEIRLGKNNALCVGRWHLVGKENKEMEGVFSLVLSRENEKSPWKVIHDHTSLNPSPSPSK
ncbi:MAG: hypothetical protein SFY67_15285 [Candidatus Melainabacteria bacterium]|nr:hypothetical protein [Candidatus Melainabacteria bacterium]